MTVERIVYLEDRKMEGGDADHAPFYTPDYGALPKVKPIEGKVREHAPFAPFDRVDLEDLQKVKAMEGGEVEHVPLYTPDYGALPKSQKMEGGGMNGPDPGDRATGLGRLAWAWWHSGRNVWRQEKWPGHYFFSLDPRAGPADLGTRSLTRYPDHVHIGPKGNGHQLTYSADGKHTAWWATEATRELRHQMLPYMPYLGSQSAVALAGRSTASAARKGTPKGTPKGTVKGTPKGTWRSTPKGTRRSTPKGTVKGIPKGTPKGIRRSTPQGTRRSSPQGTRRSSPQGTPKGLHTVTVGKKTKRRGTEIVDTRRSRTTTIIDRRPNNSA